MIRGAALILDMTVIVIHVHELRATPVVRVESQYSSNRLDGGGRGRESLNGIACHWSFAGYP